jgi:NTP pyrophosphatase (non-canonical NTP hydrolase)
LETLLDRFHVWAEDSRGAEVGLDIERIQGVLRTFAVERDWEQFHHPKNLAMALAGEAGELLEIYQWLTDLESRNASTDSQIANATKAELADILIYAIRLADVMQIDLSMAVDEKIEANAARYPVSRARGSARKHF